MSRMVNEAKKAPGNRRGMEAIFFLAFRQFIQYIIILYWNSSLIKAGRVQVLHFAYLECKQ